MSLMFGKPVLALFIVGLFVGDGMSGEQAARYVGSRVDGTAILAGTLTGQLASGSPRMLDDATLADDQISWLEDTWRLAAVPAGPRVEIFGDDSLAGKVIGYQRAATSDGIRKEAHYLVSLPLRSAVKSDTASPSQPSPVRVVTRYVRRIVWRPHRKGLRYTPGTLFRSKGTPLKFRSARLSGESVLLLLTNSTRRLSLSDVDEIHFPSVDTWNNYFDLLADHRANGPITRLDLTDRSRLSCRREQLMLSLKDRGEMETSAIYKLKPAWSLDLLQISGRTVRRELHHDPHIVPLSRIDPVQAESRGILGGGSWPWQRDESVQQTPLISGGRRFGWGLGTHAQTVLHYPVPELASEFRTQIGIDAKANDGGCARARVFTDNTAGTPLFESGLLIGSAGKPAAVAVDLKSIAVAVGQLILQSDWAHEDRPPEADPFDIRDLVDWLEPAIELDAKRLSAEVDSRRTASAVIPTPPEE